MVEPEPMPNPADDDPVRERDEPPNPVLPINCRFWLLVWVCGVMGLADGGPIDPVRPVPNDGPPALSAGGRVSVGVAVLGVLSPDADAEGKWPFVGDADFEGPCKTMSVFR
jgi:hypothetical protein